MGLRLNALGKMTAAVLKTLMAPQVGREDICDSIGYIENSGTPIGSIVPDFDGQWCADISDPLSLVWYRSHGHAANTDWTGIGDVGTVSAGTVTASKPLVVDENKDLTNLRQLNVLGTGEVATNQALGSTALDANTTGANNVAIGIGALSANTVGADNTAIGKDALLLSTTGVNNTAVGSGAGNTITTGTGNTILGQASVTSAATSVDQIVLGRGVSGVADSAITLGNATRAITCNYDADQTWDAPSDLRMKNVVGYSELGLDFINLLKPIEYTFKPVSEWPAEWGVDPDGPAPSSKTILGLGAQDVKAAMDALGVSVFHGWDVSEKGQQMVGEAAFVYPLINAVKQLASRVKALEG